MAKKKLPQYTCDGFPECGCKTCVSHEPHVFLRKTCGDNYCNTAHKEVKCVPVKEDS